MGTMNRSVGAPRNKQRKAVGKLFREKTPKEINRKIVYLNNDGSVICTIINLETKK